MSTTNHTIFKQPWVLAFTLVLSSLLACALQGALCAGVAQAAVPGLVSYGAFNTPFVEEGRPEAAMGVAVDQSSGELYVMDVGLPKIDKLDASGNLLGSPFGEGNFHTAAAVDPTNEDLYVIGGVSPAEIEIYEPSGVRVGSPFPVPASKNFYFGFLTAVQIAVDAAGDVYVPVIPENEVLEYSSSGTLLNTFTGGSGAGALKAPSGVAISPSGDLWVADTGNNRIEELGPSDSPIGEIKSEGVRDSIALDGHGEVFAIVDNSADSCGGVASPCSHLLEYNSAGVQIADVGAGAFGSSEVGEGNEFPPMVAVNETSGRVYVSDGSKDLFWVFQRPLAPVLGHESAVEVGTSEAKLGAVVNPGGIQTTYRFEYLSEAAFQADKETFSGPEEPVSVPFPEGSVGEGFSSRTVWASANGLASGTTYHYRAVVTSGVGTVVGPDETFTTETAAQVACPNEALRGGFSAALPDCRAYELVTPASKQSAQPDTGNVGAASVLDGNDAAEEGNRYSYISLEVMPGSQSAGLEFIATRGAGGWSSQDAVPLQSYTGDRCSYYPATRVLQYSADLSSTVLVYNSANDSGHPNHREGCEAEIQAVAPGEPLGAQNLLLRNDVDGSYQLINLTPPGITPTEAEFVAASANLSLVVFDERAKLTSEALDNTVNTYEWREGVVRLVKFALPSGAPVAGSLVSISPDGSDVFFTADGNLYVRLNGGERTVQVDEARGGSGPGGGGSFAGVTADGSQVFFSDEASAGLTSDTVAGSGANLYRYDIDTHQLSDLTPVSGANAGFAGIGEDGSYVYFHSEGVLSGSQANQLGETAESGKANLYADHDGAITFVMHGGGGVMSSNGAVLGFESRGNLTGYDSAGNTEIYLYSAAANRFECASCNPSGEAPAGGVEFGPSPSARHWVSNNGQVFFETSEALLPQDTNGVSDVYEFDFDSGLHLISSGTSSSESLLLPATPSGNDVFFLTRQALVPRDNSQEANKIYDARVDGGFPETALPPACTTADACRAASEPQPPIYGEPTSQTFAGAGNVSVAPSAATVKAKALTRAQKLANALAECKKDKSRSKRAKCEKTARTKYAMAKKSTAKRSNDDRRASR